MSTAAEQNQDAVAIASELPPPAEPVRKDKRWRKHPRPGALTKRPPPRPHKRVPTDVLHERVKKLTARMERAKKQHEDARRLLTKYSHEETYRLRESIQEANATATEAAAPLPEFEEIAATGISPPPAAPPS